MRRALVFAILLALPGCLESDPATEGPGTPTPSSPAGGTPTPPGPPALRTLDQGDQSGVGEAMRLVLRDEASWAAFWENHTSRQLPAPERPAVDFSREVVVAALLGQRPSGCWAVELGNATREGEAAVVEVATRSPPQGVACTAVVTYPFHVAALGHRGEVRFVEREAAGSGP